MTTRIFVAAAIAASLLATPLRAAQAPNPVSPQPSGIGLTTYHKASAASLNPTLVAAGAHVLYRMDLVNTNAATAYLKLYDKATAPTCGTDAPKKIIALIQNTPVSLIARDFGAQFSLGIGFCLTGAIADADTTNATTGASIDLEYK